MPQAILILIAAAFIGFGTGGLPGLPGLAGPLLSSSFDYNNMLPITLTLLIPIQLYGTKKHLPNNDWATCRQIVGLGLLGYIPGSYLLYKLWDSPTKDILKNDVKFFVGCLVITFALYELWMLRKGQEANAEKNGIGVFVFCFIAGFITLVAHVSGPLIALFLNRREVEPEKVAATSVISFFTLNLLKVPILAFFGHYSAAMETFRPGWPECLLLLFSVGVGIGLVHVGRRVVRWFKADAAQEKRRRSYFTLLVASVSLVVACAMIGQTAKQVLGQLGLE